MISSSRYSSTCTGEALSHAANSLRSLAERPARFATNQSAASCSMRLRTCCSLALMCSPQPLHATSTVHHRLAQVLLDHVRRNSESLRHLPVTQSISELHHDGGPAFRGELMEYLG